MENTTISAVILAGGSGARFGGDIPKQYKTLNGRPLLNYAIDAFQAAACVGEIILVVPRGHEDYCTRHIISPYNNKQHTKIVEGGQTRQESSYKGILAATGDYVLVHDGARPFLKSSDIQAIAMSVMQHRAVIMAVPARDTIKKTAGDHIVHETIDREGLWAAQTPQAFQRVLILEAHEQAIRMNFMGTDDASLVEKMGVQVLIVEGSALNMKITTPEDLLLAEAILADRRLTD